MRLAGIAALAAIATGPVVAAEGALGELEAAQDRWQAVGAKDYRFGYQKHCDCNPADSRVTVVTVTAGTIVRVFHLNSDSEREIPAREGSLELYWTIEDLFDKLAGAIARDAVVRVEFDSTFGYPRSLYIDYDPAFIGDETDLRLTQFEIL
jgi:hypothetical protein